MVTHLSHEGFICPDNRDGIVLYNLSTHFHPNFHFDQLVNYHSINHFQIKLALHAAILSGDLSYWLDLNALQCFSSGMGAWVQCPLIQGKFTSESGSSRYISKNRLACALCQKKRATKQTKYTGEVSGLVVARIVGWWKLFGQFATNSHLMPPKYSS